MWLLMRNSILKRITLVGLPHDRSWQDLPILGQEIQLPIASVQHHAIDHPKAYLGQAIRSNGACTLKLLLSSRSKERSMS